MTLEIINDPLKTALEATQALWPDLKADIQWNHALRMDKKEYGCTTFPDDGSIPLIDLNPELSIVIAVEILAHELAHVATPQDGHGEKWEEAFSAIHEKYNEIVGAVTP